MISRVLSFIRQYPSLICLLCLLIMMSFLSYWVVQKNQKEKEFVAKFEERGELLTNVFIPDSVRAIGLDKLISRERFREIAYIAIRTDTELEELAAHADLSHVTQIELRGNDITSRGLSQLAYAENLRSLYLDGVHLRKEDLQQVPLLKKLTSIQIENSTIDVQVLEQLAKCPKLNSLSFHKVKFSDKWLHVCKNIYYLSNVLIDNCPYVTDEELGHFRAIEAVNTLQLIDVPVSINCLKHFEKAKSLDLFDIRRGKKHAIAIEDLEVLREQNSLSHFGIDLPIGQSGIQLLSEMETINSVNLPAQNFTDFGFKTLCGMPNLQQLTLCGKQLTENSVNILNTKKGLQLRIEGLPDSIIQFRAFQQLTLPISISIEEQVLTSEQIDVLSSLSLESLSIKNCSFPPKSLTKLDKVSNLIIDEIILTEAELTDLILQNSYSRLYLRNAKLNDKSIPILSELQNAVLLNLEGNGFTQAGKEKLKTALPNTSVWFGEFH